MTTDAHTIVVTDANVLINLMHVTRLDMCARLPGYEFVIPDHVREEITDATQRPVVDDAVARGAFRLEAITGLTTVALFAQVIAYDDYIACKGEQGAKEAGKMRLEGKDYVVRDGDAMFFRFNV